MQRPAEEFYHTEADPFELTNLVEDAAHASLKDELSAELDRWMADQGDPGIPLDTKEAHAAAKKFQHKY